MAKYTTTIKSIVEQATSGSTETIYQRIAAAAPKIFDFPFPIYDESHRLTLEVKILGHYLMDEIGSETLGLWKARMWERLNLIMPGYNKLYEQVAMGQDIFNTINILEKQSGNVEETTSGEYDYSGTTSGSLIESETTSGSHDITKTNIGTSSDAGEDASTSSLNGTTTNKSGGSTVTTETGSNLSSDLPQANYAGVDYGTNLDETSRTTTVRPGNTENGTSEQESSGKVTHSNTRTDSFTDTDKGTENGSRTGQGTQSGTSTDKGIDSGSRNLIEGRMRTLVGKQGGESYAELFLKYGQSVLNVDNMIIRDLADMFMQIF